MAFGFPDYGPGRQGNAVDSSGIGDESRRPIANRPQLTKLPHNARLTTATAVLRER
jgi:hypothetical protein